MNTKLPRLLYVTLVVFLLAAGMSVYMTYHHYLIVSGDLGFGHSFCSINGTIDCDDVIGSKYAEILTVPLSTFATAYYLLGAFLCLIGVRSPYRRRDALLMLFGLSSVSVGVSITTFVVSFFVLNKICLLCSSLQIANVATFGLSWYALRAFRGEATITDELDRLSVKRMGIFAAIGLVLFVASHGALSQLKIDHYPLPDAETFVNEFRQHQPVKIDVESSPKQGFQGANPPLLLVEFADFQCPACGLAARFMHRILPRYKDKIQLVFKNFPLDSACNPAIQVQMHKYACYAAKAGLCAKKQGKFAEMYEKLFGHQEELLPENIEGWAREIGLDMKAFDECIPSPDTAAELVADASEGTKAGLESTPTFFANGRMIKGPIDEARLELLLKEFAL